MVKDSQYAYAQISQQLVPTSFIADVIHQHPIVARCPEAEKLLLTAYRWHSSARRDTRKVRHTQGIDNV